MNCMYLNLKAMGIIEYRVNFSLMQGENQSEI